MLSASMNLLEKQKLSVEELSSKGSLAMQRGICIFLREQLKARS